MVLLFVASVTTAWIVALFSLATADSDLSLQLRGRHKPNAFQGKVVWVTGASQVGRGTAASCVPARILQPQGNVLEPWQQLCVGVVRSINGWVF